ncbi:MAG: hypothetical protein JST17_13355 [Bacteroidetes bacterium]|nr:hypothetical protein [Bacteroidota bacterium]MBS1930996.1 hypothetical protein [Bacteroidota bacterium]
MIRFFGMELTVATSGSFSPTIQSNEYINSIRAYVLTQKIARVLGS